MLAALFLSLVHSAPNLENSDVKRNYQIKEAHVVVTVEFTLTNHGKAPVDSFEYTLEPRELAHLNKISISTQKSKAHQYESSLKIVREKDTFKVTLPKALDQEASITLFAGYSLSQYILFTVPSVTLNEKIPVFFNTSAKFISPYPTTECHTTVSGFSRVELTSYTQSDKINVKSTSITYGPITEDDKDHEFFIEYSHRKPMPYVAQVIAQTEVSHWGITKQTAFIEVINDGPKFTGEFNRVDFKETSTPCYIKDVQIIPPHDAYDFWARDEAGELQRELHLSGRNLFIPLRGPMLSSWKATFTTGWTIPTSKFVHDHYIFEAPLFPSMLTASLGKVTCEIIFPEGATIKDVQIPELAGASYNQSTKVFNLDWKGRQVVTITAEKLSTDEPVPVHIEYTLSENAPYFKMAYISAGFGLAFLAIVILRRVDCSIEEKEKTN